MPTLTIVPATESDIPVILELVRALAEYEKLAECVTATEERLRATLFCAKPAAEVLLAHWDSECAGFAVFFETYSTFLGQAGLYLEDLYVRPHLRGKGIGFALLKRLAELAGERDYGRLEWSVLNWNQPAIDFYERLGAVAMDEWTRYRLEGEPLTRLKMRT